MNIVVILNGISKKKKRFYYSILPPLKQKFSVEVLETQFANHARQLAIEAASKGPDIIISAGGDGTLNQVLNGMMSVAKEKKLPALGLIPLGSGNDFARSANLTDDPVALVELFSRNNPLPTDVGKLVCRDKNRQDITHYFINVCSLGMGPATVQQMEKAPKWLGADLKYFLSILKTFFTHKPESVEVQTPAWKWKGSARVVAIANGQSFGNKIFIAPDARLDDGSFSTFIAGTVPLLKFLLYLQKIKGKRKVKDNQIFYNSSSAVELTSAAKLMLETEGELIGVLPAKIEIVIGKIPFLRNEVTPNPKN